mgnify:CR=1 FL=1
MKIPKLMGMSMEDFKEFRKKKEWLVVKNDKPIFKDYFSWKEADNYLNSYGLSGHYRMPQLQIIHKNGKYCHKKAEFKLQKREIFDHWKRGNSFVLTLSEFLNKQLWTQCEDFEEYFGRGQANIYMSSRQDAKCFPTHADTTENFLFHVRGTVRWYIYNETEYDCKPHEATIDKVIDLTEGDLLYLPPKLYHRVETLGPRISISFHFHPPEKQGSWREAWLDWIGDINGTAK